MAKKNFRSQEYEKLVSYILPRYIKGKRHYVEFYCYNPEKCKLTRIRKHFDNIKNVKLRNRTALDFVERIAVRLLEGWNPFLEGAGAKEYTTFTEASAKYEEYLDKLMAEGGMRSETVLGYKSRLHILNDWVEEHKDKIYYSYQFNGRNISRFLDYVFIERNNTVRTRNNYYNWLCSFCNYLTERQYVPSNPMASVQRLKSKGINKNRDIIPEDVLRNIHDFLMENNKHFLLACYVLHYILIRPHEMTFLKIEDISIINQTIRVKGEYTKNHNDATLTLPKKVIKLMLDLDVFSSPGHYYLFSEDFKPGEKQISEKKFRDYWTGKMRKKLKFSDKYKFYSLKDTGITNMIKDNLDVITVRDQARHSSIEMTDTYTPHNKKKADSNLTEYEGVL